MLVAVENHVNAIKTFSVKCTAKTRGDYLLVAVSDKFLVVKTLVAVEVSSQSEAHFIEDQ